jgi:hypothetical protein
LVEHFPAEVVVGQLGSGAGDDWQCFLRPNAIHKVVSMFKRKNSDPFKNAEAELDRLRSRRDELANRLHSAEAAAEVAVRAQREALVAEDLDGTAVKRAEDDCFRATFRRDALGDALEETERLLAEGEEELAADRDAAERAKAADDLVQRAAEIDVAAARFPEAVAAVADLHAAFIQLVQTKGLRFEVNAGLERSAEHIGFNTLHAALSALPVQVERRHPDAPPARGVREVVRDQLTDQMRALAEAIRTGSADFAGNQPLSAPEARDAIVIAEREVVLREPILYVGLDRRPVQVCGGAVRLPEPVALAALEQGIGHEPGTPEAQDILRGLEQGNTSYGYRDGYLDIGVDLAEVVAQERQRLAEKAAA